MPLSQTITRENAKTYANKAPADITAHNIVPVATLPPPEQLPAPGSGHRAGWVLGSEDNTCIAREFGMIKFQHFMFVPHPPFQRSAIFELGPKGDFSPSPPALPLLHCCLSARTQTTQARGKPPHTSFCRDFPLSVSCYCCYFYHYCLYNLTVEPRPWLGTGPFQVQHKHPDFLQWGSPTRGCHCVLSGRRRSEMQPVL